MKGGKSEYIIGRMAWKEMMVSSMISLYASFILVVVVVWMMWWWAEQREDAPVCCSSLYGWTTECKPSGDRSCVA